MDKRIDISQLEPNAFKAMFGLEKYLGGTELKASLKELIKIHASQINGCAYCIQMHAEEALRHGDTEQRIFALSAWKESPLFSEIERTFLALTEQVTLISKSGLSREIYDGFYPDKTDTSEKPDNGRGGVLCQNAGSIQTSSNEKLYS